MPLPSYARALTLGSRMEWRFHPRMIDLNGDGQPDLVATARLAKSALHMWWGDGRGGFSPVDATWTNVGYGDLATGDVNGDGSTDVVSASHFGGVQTLLSDGRGGFTEKSFKGEDGYTAAQLADLNGDGHLDLILVGYLRFGIEVYLGDGTGNWTLHARLPQSRPGATMPGRDLLVGDLDHDGHLDLVAAFQLWGVYIYYGDGSGGFTGGPVDFYSPIHEFESLALGDVNRDGHPDIVINGTRSGGADKPDGPDVYLGDGRRGWNASSGGLKVLARASGAITLADLDRDGNLDIVAGGRTGSGREGYGLFWFRGDGKGGWSLVQDSGLPARGLPVVEGVDVADLDHDGVPEIVLLTGSGSGSITIWKRQ